MVMMLFGCCTPISLFSPQILDSTFYLLSYRLVMKMVGTFLKASHSKLKPSGFVWDMCALGHRLIAIKYFCHRSLLFSPTHISILVD